MAAFDVIVIGSGFGGGIAACRLAEAGQRVCVLERGRRFAGADFVDEWDEAPQLLWHDRINPGGMFDVRLMRDVAVITAAGVGGGSLVYANVQLRAPAEVFGSGWPAGIDRAALDPWYDRTEAALDPQLTPLDPELRKVDAFAAAAQQAGHDAERLPIAVHFGEPREHPFSGVRQEGCQNLGRCDIGCPVLAKNTVDITYIARAEAHGAEVHAGQQVTRLTPPRSAGGGWEVCSEDLATGARRTWIAPRVVVAAGALGSTRLLLQNRRRIKGLSPALGSRFSGNGDALAVAFEPQAPGTADARNDLGPVMTSRIDLTASRALMAADGGLPGNFQGLLDVARGVQVVDGWRRWLLRLVNCQIKLGWSDRQLNPKRVTVPPKRPNRDALIYLLIGRDAADGRMKLTCFGRKLDIRWKRDASKRLFDDLERTASELGAATQSNMFYPLGSGVASKFTTVHPLGGCPMADDPAHGVVDPFGKVHGVDGLWVLDGSIVPTSLGVNPSKTIAALAERGVARLVEELA